MKKKLSDYLWEYLSEIGIKNVFMFPGGGAMHLVDSLGKNKNIEYTTLLHEQACAIAAETQARITSNIGVALVTSGPGGTNTITGVAAAWLESTPVLFISGQAKTSDLKGKLGVRQKGPQEVGIIEIVKSITKYAVIVDKPHMIKFHLQKAVYLAKQGRQGAVWLDIPLDIQAAIIETDNLQEYIGYENLEMNNNQLDKQIKEMFGLLNTTAKRPVIIAGQGVRRANAVESFMVLVEKFQVPVLTTWLGSDIIPDDYYLKIGKPGMIASRAANFTLQNADLIISIGARLDFAVIGFEQDLFAPRAKKIFVDIDKSELNKFSFKIDIPVHADAGKFIHSVLKNEELLKSSGSWKEWLDQCRNWKRKYPIMLPEYSQEKDKVNVYHFCNILSKLADKDEVIIPGSSGAGIDAFWMSFNIKEGQRVIASGGLGSMGYAIPSSIGACIASGKKRIICVDGDGSIQLNIQELASIKGNDLPIKCFVLSNKGYLSIKNMQKDRFNGNYVGSDKESKLYLPDIEKVAASYGFKVFSITSHSEMEEIIKKVLSITGPVLCNVELTNNFSIQPKVVSEILPNGSIRSKSLEDMYPFLPREELRANMYIEEFK
jgi:acetolactate synthase-1/2/3 large subunit